MHKTVSFWANFDFFSLDRLKMNFLNVWIYIFKSDITTNSLNGHWFSIFNFASKTRHFFTQSLIVGLRGKNSKKWSDSSILTSLGNIFCKKLFFVAPTQEAVEGGACHSLSLCNIIPCVCVHCLHIIHVIAKPGSRILGSKTFHDFFRT